MDTDRWHFATYQRPLIRRQKQHISSLNSSNYEPLDNQLNLTGNDSTIFSAIFTIRHKKKAQKTPAEITTKKILENTNMGTMYELTLNYLLAPLGQKSY